MSFLYPAWFITLSIIPLILLGAFLIRRNRQQTWQKFVSKRHQHHLVKRTNPALSWISLIVSLLALALLITAMARPYYGEISYREKINTRNVLVAIDTSLSMLAKDITPNRLEASKAIAIKLMGQIPDDRIGIMAFAGSANVITSLTIDHPTIAEVITQLDTESAHIKGSDLSAAVRTGIQTLSKTGQQANALIILTDGSEMLPDMEELLDLAAAAKVQIFCIGMATEAGSDFNYNGRLHRDRFGRVVVSKLEKRVLEQLAIGTSGEYIDGNLRAEDSISRAIKKMDKYELEGREQFIPKELYQWFLAPGLVLIVLAALVKSSGFRRLRCLSFRYKSAAPLAIMVSLSFLSNSEAQDSWYDNTTQQLFDKPAEISNGYAALEAGKFAEAIDHLSRAIELSTGQQHAKLSLAIAQAYYRSGDFANARISYGDAIISSDKDTQFTARYNLSTTLFKDATKWLQSPEGMAFPTYLKLAIKGEQGVAKLSSSQLDSTENDLKITIDQYKQTLDLNPAHSLSKKNKTSAESLLKLIQDTRREVEAEQQQEKEKKEEEKKEEEKKKEESKKPEDNKGDEKDENQEKQDDSEEQDDSDDGNNGDDSEKEGDPENSGDSGKEPDQSQEGENGNMKSSEKSGDEQSGDQDIPRSEDDQDSQQKEQAEPEKIEKFNSKEEALEFLKRNQDSKKKPLDQYNSRFWRKPPTVDW